MSRITLDARALKESQLDGLREVASIGAGHAATALSTMTGHTIMISVPRTSIARLGDVPSHVAPDEEPVVAVEMGMHGGLEGRTLLLFPVLTALRLSELMLRRVPGSSSALDELEESAVREASNILAGAYMNALSDFLDLPLLPTPPRLVVARSAAVLAATGPAGIGETIAVAVETEFSVRGAAERLRGFFLLLPDMPSLEALLRAIRLA